MRTTWIIQCVLLLLTAAAEGAHVQFYFGDFTTATEPLTNRVLTVIPTNSTPRASGNQITTSDRRRYTNDSSASVTISNMVTSSFHCVISGPFKETAFQITVPDTNVLLNAKDLLSTGTNSPPGSVAYSMSAADARFVQKSNSWSSGQVLSNAAFAGSTNFFTVPTNDVVQGTTVLGVDTNGNVFASQASSGVGGSNYLFNANQFASTAGGTNLSIKAGALVTNLNTFGLTNQGPVNFSGTVTNHSNQWVIGSLTVIGGGSLSINELISTGDIDAGEDVTAQGNLLVGDNFEVNGASGDIVRLRGEVVSFPDANAPGVLRNDGTINGVMSWDNSLQAGSATLTNLSGTGAITNVNANQFTYSTALSIIPASKQTNNNFYGSVTNIGTLEQQGAQTNAGALNVTGPASNYGAATNRSTVRNMGGVTNDANVLTVGAVENQSTSTNTGAINNAAGVTNWANTLMIGAVEARSTTTNTGAINNAAAVTNWNTLTQLGAQTNNSSLNVAGPVSHYGNSTNVGTLRQQGNQTNDADLQVSGHLAVGANNTATNYFAPFKSRMFALTNASGGWGDWMAGTPSAARRNWFLVQSSGGGISSVGCQSAASIGSVVNAEANTNSWPLFTYTTAASNLGSNGIVSQTGASTLSFFPGKNIYFCYVGGINSMVTNRTWIGLTSATSATMGANSDTPTSSQIAAFRFSATATGALTNWSLVTCDGSACTVNSGPASLSNTNTHIFEIMEDRPNTRWLAWIDGICIATNTANLPISGMRYIAMISTGEGVAKTIRGSVIYGEMDNRIHDGTITLLP